MLLVGYWFWQRPSRLTTSICLGYAKYGSICKDNRRRSFDLRLPVLSGRSPSSLCRLVVCLLDHSDYDCHPPFLCSSHDCVHPRCNPFRGTGLDARTPGVCGVSPACADASSEPRPAGKTGERSKRNTRPRLRGSEKGETLMNPIAKETKATKELQLGINSARTAEDAVSRRAQSLADRIELGAARLVAFAEELTEAEWRTPVSPTDPRSIGVIVHHVASVYPVEIDLARAIASGKAVTDVTWEVVAQMNADHAQENVGISKPVAIALLRRNSREAADIVRTFTDGELDRVAPFSLSSGRPVTAQSVIEEHALGHSLHHLAAIRRALSW